MDGRTDRAGCEEGEERCDTCELNGWREVLPNVQEEEGRDGAMFETAFVESDSGRQQGFVGPQSSMESRARSDREVAHGLMTTSNIDLQQRQQVEHKQVDMAFEKQQRERQWLETEWRKRQCEEGHEGADFENELAAWANRCPLCHLRQRRNTHHRLETCADASADNVLKSVFILRKESIQVVFIAWCHSRFAKGGRRGGRISKAIMRWFQV